MASQQMMAISPSSSGSRAPSPPDTSPAFYNLPEELLVMIMEQMLRLGEFSFLPDLRWLKNLRLASPKYAYNTKLLSILFESVHIDPSMESYETLQSRHVSFLGPHVKYLTFGPGKYSWTMTQDHFRSIMIARTLYKYCQISEPSNHEAEKRASRIRIEQLPEEYLDQHSPLGEQKLRQAYEEYMKRANNVRRSFETGRLRDAGATALPKLSRVQCLSTEMWDFDDCPQCDDPADLINGHFHNGLGLNHTYSDCLRFQQPVAEAVVKTVFEALGDAGSTVRELCIAGVGDGEFLWADDGTLDAVDLSKMQRLVFAPWCKAPKSVGCDWSPQQRDSVEKRSGLAATALLKKSGPSLEEVEILSRNPEWPAGTGSHSPTLFPADDVALLPALGSFVSTCRMDPSKLATFIVGATDLTYLSFDIDRAQNEPGSWRKVWRAIRYHPTRMMLVIPRFPNGMEDGPETIIQTEVSGDEQFPSLRHETDALMSLPKHLANYLSGTAKWNAVCRMFFEERDGEHGDVSDEDDL